MAKIIGITGGIGSGKTTIANYFMEKNIPVYIADVEANKISNSKKIVKKIIATFGSQVIKNELINRVELAKIVFNDKQKLALLNNIIHPEVKKHFAIWKKNNDNAPFVIKESAILFESGSYKECDKIILITAPLELRIERAMKRDNSTRESILQKMKNQISDEEKIAKADFVIHNINLEDTLLQVDLLLKKLK